MIMYINAQVVQGISGVWYEAMIHSHLMKSDTRSSSSAKIALIADNYFSILHSKLATETNLIIVLCCQSTRTVVKYICLHWHFTYQPNLLKYDFFLIMALLLSAKCTTCIKS